MTSDPSCDLCGRRTLCERCAKCVARPATVHFVEHEDGTVCQLLPLPDHAHKGEEA